jgi:hypothetical protein
VAILKPVGTLVQVEFNFPPDSRVNLGATDGNLFIKSLPKIISIVKEGLPKI